MIQKSYTAKQGEVTKGWFVLDAEGLVLGRLAVEIARRLQGKHKPRYTAHIDCGDFIVVTNAEKVVLTGKKDTDKIYQKYTGYLRGRKVESAKDVRQAHPERLIERAVLRMLPKSRLGRRMFKKLKVYAGPDHPHAAQAPTPLTAESFRRV